MDASTKIWSVVTVISTAALLVLLGQEYGDGLFNSQSSESDESVILSSTADNPDPRSNECVTLSLIHI